MKLEVRGLTKSFGEKQVLTNVCFEASSGQALGLLGRNGAGKTTSIRLIMGIFEMNQGEVLLDDQPIDYKSVGIGYLPEERGMYPKKKIIDQLVYFGLLKNMDKKSAIKSADYWLNRLDMMEYRDKKLETLSKGNQQKIQLITAIIADPKIVILDEPFSGLDPVNAMLLKDVVNELIAGDKIVLFSSHQMNYIEEFCDRIVILNRGEVVLSGSLKQIKKNYDRRTISIRCNDYQQIQDTINFKSEYLEDELRIYLDQASQKNDLFLQLSSMNIDIDEMRVVEPSLNDIFVEYTEDK